MITLLLTVLMGCGGGANYVQSTESLPDQYADPQLDQAGAGAVLQLHLAEGRYVLPDHSRPPNADSGTEFVVSLTEKSGARHPTFLAQLPFDVDNQGRRFAPTGMVVEVDGKEARYGRGATHWDVDGSKLTVQAQSGMPNEVRVSWPKLGEQLTRHSFDEAELEAFDFVRYRHSIDGDTRDGLLLPAPATAAWDTTLGLSPVFSAYLALAPSPLITESSDGAVAVIEVIEGGTTTEVGRWPVSKVSKRFQRIQADLSAFAGKTVTVQLRSEPGGNTHHDYLFFGSPTVWSAPTGDVRRVIVIGLDTTRPDHFGFYGEQRPDVSPELDSIANNAIVFDQGFTPAPRTRPSFRSATTGRSPLNAVGAVTIGQVFQAHGFATEAHVANVHLQPRFGFNAGFDRWHFKIGASAEDQVDRGLAFLNENQSRDSYLFMHIMDPHVFYDAPGSFKEKFVPAGTPRLPAKTNRWEVYAIEAKGELTDGHREWLESLYRGELAYVSYQIGRFFAEIDKLPGKSLVIIHSDHGEEFWEHGGYEHNHTLYNDVTKAFLVVRPNRGFKGGMRIDTPAILADIAPTLYDFAGFAADTLPPTDGQSLRPLINGSAKPDNWTRPLGIGHLRYGQDRWGVVHNGHKYIVHTKSGQEELYNLQIDPDEQNDLAAEQDTTPFQAALSEAHEMPVGPGWRLTVNARANSAPLLLKLPAVPEAVVLIDPERVVEHRANQAWGEPPTRVPSEIGIVSWEPGSDEFEWQPGSSPRDGLIFVRFAEPQDATTVIIRRNTLDFPVRPYKTGARWSAIRDAIVIMPGVVFEPPIDEAARMKAQGTSIASAGGDRAMLEALGYIHDEDENEDEDEDDAQDTETEATEEPTP